MEEVLIIFFSGLCVDYSVHVAHAFLANGGSRDERVKLALTEIGNFIFRKGKII